MSNPLFNVLFTFHNVSINTIVAFISIAATSTFTFHNVSINTDRKPQHFFLLISLHSTMFLLIHKNVIILPPPNLPLHSTMFLLILRP